MDTLIASGRIIDLILMLVLLEAFALIGWCVWRGGPSPVALASNLAAGAALMLAVRAALQGANWMVLATCLAVALIAHVIDVGLRFRAAQAGQVAAVGGTIEPEHPRSRARSWPGVDL